MLKMRALSRLGQKTPTRNLNYQTAAKFWFAKLGTKFFENALNQADMDKNEQGMIQEISDRLNQL